MGHRKFGWFSGLLALAWSLGGGPGMAQPPPEKVDLTGTVVVEDTGKPVAGATLTLRRPPDAQWEAYRGGRATSDEAGRFTFQGVEEGTYELSVSSEDYANLQQTLRVVAPEPAPLKLALRPLPVVTGRLLRPDGTPLAQAPVRAYLRIDGISVDRISEGRGGGGGNWEITTDIQGRYRVPLRSPGLAKLVFVVPDVGGERISFTVPEGGDVAGPDVTLRPLASVRGQVRRRGTGEPIAKANVAADILGGTSVAEVTDEKGWFTFRNLVSGTLRLRASAPDYRPCLQRIPAEPGEEVSDIICELRPCPSLRGRLLGPDGQPLAGITAQMDITTPVRSEESKVTTDAEGKFSVTLKDPGRTRVRVQVAEVGQALSPWFTVGEEELEVERAFVVRPLPKVAGVVRNQNSHEPIPAASVRLQRQRYGSEGPEPPWGESGLEAETGQDGQFLLRNVTPGVYSLWVSAKGFLSGSDRPVIIGDQSVEGPVVELSPGMALTGRVVGTDGAAKQAVAGAAVNISGQQVATDAEGGFILTGLRPGSSLSLLVRAKDFAPVHHRAFVPALSNDEGAAAGTPGEVTLTLAYRGATLGGQVRDEKGQTLPGAFVVAVDRAELYPPDINSLDQQVQGNRGLLIQQETRQTDDAGRYEFTHLAEGEYWVAALAPGKVPAQRDGLVLKEGDEVRDLDLTLAPRLPEPAQEARSVRLRLLRPDGTPLAFESVPLRLDIRSSKGNRGIGTSLLTNEQGTLTLSLRPGEGTHDLLLRPEGYASVGREHLERAEGEVTVTLEETPAAMVGRVLRPDGPPAVGVMVVPFTRTQVFADAESHPSYHGIMHYIGWNRAVETDAEGRFRLSNLDPGTYGLYFIPPSDKGMEALPPMFGPWVEVAKPETEVGEVRLVPGGTVSGTVVSAEGQPLPGVTVQVYTPWDDRHFVGRSHSTETDAAGRFRVGGLPSGMYGISVFLPGLAGGFLDDVCVAAGQSVEGLRLRLRSLRYGYLEGRVLRPDGQTPAAQARVLLLNLAESVLWDWQIAEPDGRFHLDGLRPGHYRILAWKAGDTLSPPVEVVIRPDQTTEGVRLVLREGGTVRGRVIPPDNGRQGGVALPLRVAVLPAEVDVGILRQGGVSLAGLVRFAVPDAEGRFTVSDVAPGPQQVLALIEGTVRARQDVTVVAGQTAEAELRLTAADGVLTGIVTDEAGKPLENAKVWAASRLNAPNQYRTTTDRKGRFSFADLPRGTYRVFAEADGRANLTLADVSVTGEAPAAVALRLPVGDRIAGRVVGPDGQPMADAAVSTEASARTWEPPENGLTLRRTNTDETGHFELPRLAPGDYRVTIWAEGLRKQTSAPVTVQEGETPPLEVRLEAEPETP